jgi:outer membrane lipopolysaccharide assembly protein LptE/RlpB
MWSKRRDEEDRTHFDNSQQNNGKSKSSLIIQPELQERVTKQIVTLKLYLI